MSQYHKSCQYCSSKVSQYYKYCSLEVNQYHKSCQYWSWDISQYHKGCQYSSSKVCQYHKGFQYCSSEVSQYHKGCQYFIRSEPVLQRLSKVSSEISQYYKGCQYCSSEVSQYHKSCQYCFWEVRLEPKYFRKMFPSITSLCFLIETGVSAVPEQTISLASWNILAWLWIKNITPHMSRLMTKPTKWHVRPAKTQISLSIRPVWSVFAVRMKKTWFLIYPLSAQQRLWTDWADAQADLSKVKR